MGDFSFASVILSYFLVAGGLLTGALLVHVVKPTNEILVFACLGAGALLGGFVAARASRGSTILETAIGAIAVVATIAAVVGGTDIGKYMWNLNSDATTKFVAALAGSSAVGALVGAALSEKLFGEATTSSLPWVIYSGFATFGACFLATAIAAILFVDRQNTIDTLAKMMLAGVGIGCLVAGLAVGASARIRTLFASLVGGGAGVAGFFLLFSHNTHDDKDTIAGIAVIAVGGAIVTLIGTALGWGLIGKRSAA